MAPSGEGYHQGHAESVVRSQRWRTVENSAAFLTAELHAGRTVLDVGCGPGTITVDIARHVTPGTVVGVDPTESVLTQGRRHAEDAGVDNVEFQAGDANQLDFPDDTFDIVHAHQVLLHLTDPVAALREMLRVAKPAVWSQPGTPTTRARSGGLPMTGWTAGGRCIRRWRGQAAPNPTPDGGCSPGPMPREPSK